MKGGKETTEFTEGFSVPSKRIFSRILNFSLCSLWLSFVYSLLFVSFAPADTYAVVEQEVGKVKDIKGSADILRDRRQINARKNEPVFGVDTVKTSDKSRARILFIDDSLLMIGEKSSVRLSDEYRKMGGNDVPVFNLMEGAINVIVGKKGFVVHTPTAVTAARGTSFIVWVEKEKTGITVTEGRVEVGNIQTSVGEKMLVSAGRTSYVETGKPPVVAVKTHPDTLRRYYEQTLPPNERWGPVILTATGSGIPPPNVVNTSQGRLMALRAARVEALRNLLEQSLGVSIMADSTIKDFVLKNDIIKSKLDSFIKGAWIAEERQLADGTIEVDMEIALGIGFRRMLLGDPAE